MQQTKSLFSILIAVFLLSACSYFEDERETIGVEKPSNEKIVLYDADAENEAQRQESHLQEVSTIKKVGIEPVHMGALASTMSNGSVQVFSLDGDIPAPVPPRMNGFQFQKASRNKGAIVGYNVNPSVEVFPLDEDMARALSLPGVKGGFLGDPPGALTPLKSSAVALSNPYATRIYFDHDSTKLDATDLGIVAQVANGYSRPALLSIEGHASVAAKIKDPEKRKTVNLKVSMERAYNVARALIKDGIPADVIKISGWGEARPSQAADGMDAESASRRVEIFTNSGQ